MKSNEFTPMEFEIGQPMDTLVTAVDHAADSLDGLMLTLADLKSTMRYINRTVRVKRVHGRLVRLPDYRIERKRRRI